MFLNFFFRQSDNDAKYSNEMELRTRPKNASILGQKFCLLIFYLYFIKYKCVCLPVKWSFSFYSAQLVQFPIQFGPTNQQVASEIILFLFIIWPSLAWHFSAGFQPLVDNVWLNKKQNKNTWTTKEKDCEMSRRGWRQRQPQPQPHRQL